MSSELPLACGDIQAERAIERCRCGCIRQANRPHGYRALQLVGWFCTCGIFNGEEKELKTNCRYCDRERPADDSMGLGSRATEANQTSEVSADREGKSDEAGSATEVESKAG